MGTTTAGLPYPEPGDTPDVPRDIKALAEKAAAKTYVDAKVQSGRTTVPAAGMRVTFPTQFAAAPRVVATVDTNTQTAVARAYLIDAAGFTLDVRYWSGAGFTATDGFVVNWVAVAAPGTLLADEPQLLPAPDAGPAVLPEVAPDAPM